MTVREATPDDWPAIYPFLRDIVAAGETFGYDRDLSERRHAVWMLEPPRRTVVAVGPDGAVLGRANMDPNHAHRV
jgi:hypothetical protein